jgi:hypothetical protein
MNGIIRVSSRFGKHLSLVPLGAPTVEPHDEAQLKTRARRVSDRSWS